jgi:hypothetical protein
VSAAAPQASGVFSGGAMWGDDGREARGGKMVMIWAPRMRILTFPTLNVSPFPTGESAHIVEEVKNKSPV